MAITLGVLLPILAATCAVTTWALATEHAAINLTEKADSPKATESSKDDTTLQSRSDYPDFEDLSSFFDFELGPTEDQSGDSYSQSTESDESSKSSPNSNPNRSKHYYYYGPDYQGAYYTKSKHPYHASTKKELVTPGTHYKSTKPVDYKTDSRPPSNQAIVGPYQVSVVDSKSPLLSSLGFHQNDLEMLAGSSRRYTTNNTNYMVASDSIPSSTYAEYPRSNYPHSPSSYQPSPSYENSKYPPNGDGYSNSDQRPKDYYPSENPQPYRNHAQPPVASHPPPQGSYDGKSYSTIPSPVPQNHGNYNYPPPSYGQAPSSSYGTNNAPSEPWRSSSSPAHTDWDDKEPRKQVNSNWQLYPPHPPPLVNSNSAPYHSKPQHNSYSASERPVNRPSPSYGSPETTGPKTSYGSTRPSSSSNDYHSHKPSYYSPPSYSSHSSTAKAPARAGSVSYTSASHSHHHPAPPPGKPGLTIRFKAKSPGSHGLNIPLNFNPLELVKKLIPLSALNPLHNKKVTIGITIENKKEDHQHY